MDGSKRKIALISKGHHTIRCVLGGVLTLILVCTACGKKQAEISREHLAYDSVESPDGTAISCISIETETGTVYGFTEENLLFKIDKEGVLTTQSLSEDLEEAAIQALCIADDGIYAADSRGCRVLKLTKDGVLIETVCDVPEFMEIKALELAESSLYYLAVPFPEFDSIEEHGDDASAADSVELSDLEMRFAEAYRISLTDGVCKRMDVNNPICQYIAGDGQLYYYVYQNDSYQLLRYRFDNGETVRIADTDALGFMNALVYENGNLYYADGTWNRICKASLSGQEADIYARDVFILHDGDFYYWRGNVIFLNRVAGKIQVIPIEAISEISGNSGEDSSGQQRNESYTDHPYVGTELVIGTSGNAFEWIDTEKVGEMCGIQAVYRYYPADGTALVTKLMAGDPEPDIYLFSTSYTTGRNIRKQEMYYDLRQSEGIQDYLEDCFSYLRDYAETDNGQIWCVPLAATSYAVWYSPEQMAAAGLDTSSLATLDRFFTAMETVNSGDGAGAYADTYSFCYSYHFLYSLLYNDVDNGILTYDSDDYTLLLERLWGDWVFGIEEKPYFSDITRNMVYVTDPENMVLAYTHTSYMLQQASDPFTGFRIGPQPALSSVVSPGSHGNPNAITVYYAVINPDSEKKEAALTYLECLCENRLDVVRFGYEKYPSTFTTAGIRDYEAYYDITQPAFQDLLAIYENGAVWEASYYTWDSEIFMDYQNGLCTAEEAAAEIQRRAEMMLYE